MGATGLGPCPDPTQGMPESILAKLRELEAAAAVERPDWLIAAQRRQELDADLDALNPAAIEWAKIKRSVNRLSIRDLTAAIVPAIHAHKGRVLIGVERAVVSLAAI